MPKKRKQPPTRPSRAGKKSGTQVTPPPASPEDPPLSPVLDARAMPGGQPSPIGTGPPGRPIAGVTVIDCGDFAPTGTLIALNFELQGGALVASALGNPLRALFVAVDATRQRLPAGAEENVAFCGVTTGMLISDLEARPTSAIEEPAEIRIAPDHFLRQFNGLLLEAIACLEDWRPGAPGDSERVDALEQLEILRSWTVENMLLRSGKDARLPLKIRQQVTATAIALAKKGVRLAHYIAGQERRSATTEREARPPTPDLPALRSELEQQIVEILVNDDGSGLLSSSAIAERIASRYRHNSPDAIPIPGAVLRALQRMREQGWPIETKNKGSRIPPGQRYLLPEAFRQKE